MIRLLKNCKAEGLDGLNTEIIKGCGEPLIKLIWRLCQVAYKEKMAPSTWMQTIIIPIYKKGGRLERSNYRPIAISSVLYKIYAKILTNRLTSWLEANKIIPEEQGGFRKQRSAEDQIFTLRETISNHKGKLYTAFLDVSKAYDAVLRKALWLKLRAYGVTEPMVEAIQSLYHGVKGAVKCGDKLSPWFDILSGVRQGCPMSPMLYATFTQDLISDLKKEGGVTIQGVTSSVKISALMYADDIVIIAKSKQELQHMLDCVSDYARQWGFRHNLEKSEVVVFRGKTKSERAVTARDQTQIWQSCKQSQGCECHWMLDNASNEYHIRHILEWYLMKTYHGNTTKHNSS